jgi:hypothetical protein
MGLIDQWQAVISSWVCTNGRPFYFCVSVQQCNELFFTIAVKIIPVHQLCGKTASDNLQDIYVSNDVTMHSQTRTRKLYNRLSLTVQSYKICIAPFHRAWKLCIQNRYFLNFYLAQESIPPAYVALRAGTTTLFLLGSCSPHGVMKNSSTVIYALRS